MAKDKADGSGKRKAAKTKIPKHIAGVKIPKTLRESGKAAIKLAQNPMARELLSAGLIAAAAAVTANNRSRRAMQDAAGDMGDAVRDASTAGKDGAAKLRTALIGAAGIAAQRFLGLDGDTPASAADKKTAAPAAATSTPAFVEPSTDIGEAPPPVADATLKAKAPTSAKRKPSGTVPTPNGKA